MGAPEGYVTVAERIQEFYEKHPKGTLTDDDVEVVQAGGKHFVLVRATATTDEDPPRSASAVAWEPIPGRTRFTQDSEAMNAETSAVGRAIALLGFRVHDGIASAEEMQAAASTRRPQAAKPPWVEPLFKKIKAALDAELISKDQLKLQLTAGGVSNPKGTKGDLARISPEKAQAIEAWLAQVVS